MKNKFLSICLSVAILISSLSCISFASASGIITTDDTFQLLDTCYVRKNKSNIYGSTELQINCGSDTRWGYMKFDLSSYSRDEIETIKSVELMLQTKADAAYKGLAVTLMPDSAENWSSSTLNYALAQSSGLISSDGDILIGSHGDTTQASKTYFSINLDAAVIKNHLLTNPGNKIISFRLEGIESGAYLIYGTNLSYRVPKLNVKTELDVNAALLETKNSLDFSLISSDAANNVTHDIDFSKASSGKHGIKIDWSSKNETIISSSGEVTRPISNTGGTDTDVELTATISYPQDTSIAPLTWSCTVTVPAREMTPVEFADDEYENLTFDDIKGENISSDGITSNLDLSYTPLYSGTHITWSSDNTDVVLSDGTVKRPSPGADNVNLNITAHISNGGEYREKTFNLTVLSKEVPDEFLLSEQLCTIARSQVRGGSKADEPQTSRVDLILDSSTSDRRLAFIKFDLSSVSSDAYSTMQRISLQLTATKEGPAFEKSTKPNFTVHIVDDDKESVLFDPDSLTYNIADANGLLSDEGTTLMYTSENNIEMSGVYETSDLMSYFKEHLASSDNKIIWLKIDTTYAPGGYLIYGMTDTQSRKPVLNIKYLKPAAERDVLELELPKTVSQNITLPTLGSNGSTISWETSDSSVISNTGVIGKYEIGEDYSKEDKTAALTASVQGEGAIYTKQFDIRVKMGGVIDAAMDISVTSDAMDVLGNTFTSGGSDKNISVIAFDLLNNEKTNISAKRKTVLKLYAASSDFAGRSVNIYPILSSSYQLPSNTGAISYSDLASLVEDFDGKPISSMVNNDGYIIFDVSDYARGVNGNSLLFLAATDGEAVSFESLDSGKVLKTPKLIVSDIAYTDAYAAKAAAENIEFGDLTYDEMSQLRFDLSLPSSGIYESSITWSVTPPDAINLATGQLNRTSSDTSITLTATAEVNGQTYSKNFEAVIRKTESDSEYLQYVLSCISLDNNILTSSVTLPGKELLDNGRVDSIEWLSSEEYEAKPEGFNLVVTRPESADLPVTLTVRVGYNGAFDEKDITVYIVRSATRNVLRNRQVVHGDASASNAVDENINTYWQISKKEIVYNLNSKRVISGITLVPYQSSIASLKVYMSDDNISYTEVYNGGSFSAENLNYISFTPAAFGKYIKFVFSDDAVGIRFLGAYTNADSTSDDVFAGVSVPETSGTDFSLPVSIGGSSVLWTSSSSAIVINGGTAEVTKQSSAINVTLTAKVTIDGVEHTKNFVVYVPASQSSSSPGIPSGPSSVITGPSAGTQSSSGTTSLPAPISKFDDLNQAYWAVEYINYLADKGIINGKSERVFAPNDYITREELAKILVLTFNVAAGENVYSFADVDALAWYAQYVNVLTSAGHINGVGNNMFGTGYNITRQDAFKMLASVIGAKADLTGLSTGFGDDADIAPYAREAILALKSDGVINGDNLGNINPKSPITRAEAAKIICLSQNINK